MQQTISPVGDVAIGTIGPGSRIATGAITNADVTAFVERLAGDEYYEEVGRLGANAAAGTFTLVIADALAARRFYRPGMRSDEHAKIVYRWLLDNADTATNRKILPRQCMDERPVVAGSQPSPALIGDHDSTHGEDDCGAIKKMEAILHYIVEHADVLRAICVSEGYDIGDDIHEQLVGGARELLDSGYAADAITMRNVLVEVAGEHAVARLDGDHNGVALRKNRQQGLTLNRDKAAADYGLAIEGFNIDVWTFEPSAKIMSDSGADTDIQKLVIAMEYYNTAAALVLGHGSIVYIRQTAV